MNITRCSWVTADPLYLDYHDTEWGIPRIQSQALFEMLCLEGQQAGLSWITVLKKRERYRQCFYNFNPQQIAQIGEEKIARLMQDEGIIRHRGKIDAIVANAQAYLTMQAHGEDFSRFIWSFVAGKPQINHWESQDQVPVTTATAKALAADLKKRQFKFVGPTICYAFMQACGLVNDHIATCCCHPRNLAYSQAADFDRINYYDTIKPGKNK